ncbi:hypothetical protein B0H17DRAFT_1140394 [Mycena rosella]|uniref:Uncharacterized protein n=1 Tax=Mycena rosella TaxID=1033263 RepID=A0AAD7GBZ3_MYCRO|nr:hypothetical protein B0H17DRAFT_1140394 [Mycena rosella]
MPSWGKVRILDGDFIQSASATGKGTGPERDSSYVRVSGKDLTEEIILYDRTTTQIVTDLQTISSLVGCIKTWQKWMIIDRSGGLIKPEFIAELVEEELGDNIL